MRHVACCLLLTFLMMQPAALLQGEETTAPTPHWQLVVGGAPVGAPLVTEYGFAVPLEGRTMAAVSGSGNLLWFAGLPGSKISPHSGTETGDFLITVSGGNSVSLINPSGLTLWSAKAPAEIISTPIQGRDGRIFVQCRQTVACLGINGTLKWTSPAGEAGGFPLMELEDGSILHIQKKTIQGCSTALRYSPFGNILEEVTFTGKVTAALETRYGAILVFSDGGVGCISAKDSLAWSRWTLPAGSIPAPGAAQLYLDPSQNQCAIVTPAGGGTTINVIQTKDGSHQSTFDSPIDSNRITFGTFDRNGIILCDSSKAVSMSVEGTVLWESSLPGSREWLHILYLPQGYIVMLEKDSWVISAYRVADSESHRWTGIQQDRLLSYPLFVQEARRKLEIPDDLSLIYGRLISPQMLDEILWQLSGDEYGEKEGQWLATATTEMTRLLSKYTVQTSGLPSEASFMDQNMDYFHDILNLMVSFESACFNQDLARLIRTEQDHAILEMALQAVAKVGYDPTMELLTSIESLMGRSHVISNPRITQLICNAVYEICRFMGKPALFTRGKYILSSLLNPLLDSRTKNHARATMMKIIALEM